MEKCAISSEAHWAVWKRRCRGREPFGAHVAGTQEMLGKVCETLGGPVGPLEAGVAGEAKTLRKLCETLAALGAA